MVRNYQPTTGRFLTEDPIKDGLNYYTYCYNNPILWHDPSGLAGEYSLTVFSDTKGGAIGGHAFVVIVNNSSNDITVGTYTLKAGQSVSLGTFGNKNERFGPFYNLESYGSANLGWSYKDYVSVQMDFGDTELDKINTFINKNDSWSAYNNCSYFAAGVWNVTSDTKLSPLNSVAWNTPTGLSKSIMQQEGYVMGRSFAAANEVGFTKDGVYTVSKIYPSIGSSGSSYTSSGGSSAPSGSSGSMSSQSVPNSSSGSSGFSSGSGSSSGPSSCGSGYRSSSSGPQLVQP